MENLAEKAFRELFPNRQLKRIINIKYSGHFKDFNANVSYDSESMQFSLSKAWKEISEDIQIGLVQHLLLKIYKSKKNTINLDLYDKFMKNITKYAKVTEQDELLSHYFDELNDQYFNGMMNKPNLIWGTDSTAKLGCYTYGTDSIMISTVLKEEPDLLKFVLYHEMLHKKHTFTTKNNKSYYHTKAFKDDEKKFYLKNAEQQLERFLKRKRWKKLLSF